MKEGRTMEHRKLNYPVSVRKQKGAEGAQTICGTADGELRLIPGSYVIFDMGAGSVGGYPFFFVKSYKGKPTLRISYSDRMIPYEREETIGLGDFTRGSCTYLGVELPVMPANPYRFEDYTIARDGLFVYPLIQGQERFVCLTVPKESDGEIVISRYGIANDSQDVEAEGFFRSDRPVLDRIWQASARTVLLATVQSRQWDVLFGKLCIRKLTKGGRCALSKLNTDSVSDVRCEFELSRTPEYETGFEFLFCAKDESNYEFVRIQQSGKVSFGRVNEGSECVQKTASVTALSDNLPYVLELKAEEGGVKISLNGENILRAESGLTGGGKFGFASDAEWRSVVNRLEIKSGEKFVYEWRGRLADFDVYHSGYFVSDGAKRDRLPWSGDVDWAFDCGWYAFGKKLQAMNTLKMFAFHQTPEGFVYGTCYPENQEKPASGDYGYYQSDMFAAWFIVSVFTYYRLSGDAAVEELMPAVGRCLDYLWQYVDEKDGLFDQRYETSKGLWDHFLGDTGKNTYTNLLLLESLNNMAEYAREHGKTADAEKCESRAERLREGIFRYLYDEEQGGFIKRKDWRELCDMANPFAMGKHLVNAFQAAQIAEKAEQLTHAYGKITVLMIRGLYDYGYPRQAEKLLCGKLPLYIDGNYSCNVDWLSAVGNPDLPETVYECMHNPPMDFGANLNWGDLSHPDSGVCGILSGYIAGVRPLRPGFKEILIRPHPGECRQIDCVVPAENGKIELQIRSGREGSNVLIRLPEGVRCRTDFSELKQPVRVVTEEIKKTENIKEVV